MVIEMANLKDEIEHLKRACTPTEHLCVIIWCADDVLEVAHEKGVKLSNSEVDKILDEMENRHDANNGINWDTIKCLIDDVVDEREKIEEEKNGKEKVQFG
jgi:hypothetical protein